MFAVVVAQSLTLKTLYILLACCLVKIFYELIFTTTTNLQIYLLIKFEWRVNREAIKIGKKNV